MTPEEKDQEVNKRRAAWEDCKKELEALQGGGSASVQSAPGTTEVTLKTTYADLHHEDQLKSRCEELQQAYLDALDLKVNA